MGLIHLYGSLWVPQTPKRYNALLEVFKVIWYVERSKMHFCTYSSISVKSLQKVACFFWRRLKLWVPGWKRENMLKMQSFKRIPSILFLYAWSFFFTWTYARVPRGGLWTFSTILALCVTHPDFGRSVNPISTRGEDRLRPSNNTGTPGFSDLATAL
jgi:hypothetical protein